MLSASLAARTGARSCVDRASTKEGVEVVEEGRRAALHSEVDRELLSRSAVREASDAVDESRDVPGVELCFTGNSFHRHTLA